MSNPSLAQAGFTHLPASLAPSAPVVELAPLEVAPSPLTISEIIAKLFEIRAKRAKLAVEEKDLVTEWERYETQLLVKLDEQGSVRVSSKLGTASISEQVLPLIEDWDAVYAYIKENDAFHLLQRRMAVNSYRELVEADSAAHPGEEESERPPVVPGTRTIVKKSINLRAGT